MKQLILYKMLVMAALLSGCQKIDVDDPVDETPVFSVKMTVNNEQKEWLAGIDDYYMFSEFEKGQDDIYAFTGRLQMENCQGTNCGEALTIRIRDFQQVNSGNPDIPNALKPGFYGYRGSVMDTAVVVLPVDTTYKVTFDATTSVGSNAGNPVYQWNFGNGSVTGQPVTTYDFQELNANNLVTLTLLSTVSNCSSSQTRRIDLNDDCAVHILYNPNALTQLTAVPGGTGPFNYMWNNGAVTQSVQVQNTFPPSSVTVTNANGCTAMASVSAQSNPGTVPPYCSARFSYSVQAIPVLDSQVVVTPNPFQFSTVVLEYMDETGVLFTSGVSQAGLNSFFEIVSVEDFDNNENGKKTKKLTVRFACRLVSPGGVLLDVKNGQAVIAVAYPG